MSSITSAGTLPPCDVGEGTGAEGVLGRVSIGIVEERDPVSVRRFSKVSREVIRVVVQEMHHQLLLDHHHHHRRLLNVFSCSFPRPYVVRPLSTKCATQ